MVLRIPTIVQKGELSLTDDLIAGFECRCRRRMDDLLWDLRSIDLPYSETIQIESQINN
jgi:hypothetical protein